MHRERYEKRAREQEAAVTSKCELVAQLTRQLHEAQAQCAQLLDASSVQEMHQLKLLVQQMRAERTAADERTQSLLVCFENCSMKASSQSLEPPFHLTSHLFFHISIVILN